MTSTVFLLQTLQIGKEVVAEFLNDSLGLIREPPSGKERHLGGDLDMVAFPRFSGNTAGHESGSRLVFSARSQSVDWARLAIFAKRGWRAGMGFLRSRGSQ